MSLEAEAEVKSDDAIHCAFFYGTLMAPEVFFTVCYNTESPAPEIQALHEFKPAVLHGYSRHRVRQAEYPGIKADAAHQVVGVFATGLTKANMHILDVFEGDQYVRQKVKVKLLGKAGDAGTGNEGDEEREANVYVFAEHLLGDLEDREWDLDEFRREKMRFWTRAGYIFDGEDDSET